MTDLDQLERIAAQLAGRVRDDHPDSNKRWLTAVLPDPGDWFRLAFVLACAVPDDRTWQALTAWTGDRRCGCSASTHRRRGEPVCPDCLRADRDRKHDTGSAA